MQPVIHVVDDDLDFREEVVEALKGEGYLVIQSGTAEQFWIFLILSSKAAS